MDSNPGDNIQEFRQQPLVNNLLEHQMMLMKKHGVGIREILVELIIYLFFSVLDLAFGSAINVQQQQQQQKKNERDQYSPYGPNKLAQ